MSHTPTASHLPADHASSFRTRGAPSLRSSRVSALPLLLTMFVTRSIALVMIALVALSGPTGTVPA